MSDREYHKMAEYQALRDEFQLAGDALNWFDVDSAMMNVDAFAEALEGVMANISAWTLPEREYVRFCPSCGYVGDVPKESRGCCPDTLEARMVPASIARKLSNAIRPA